MFSLKTILMSAFCILLAACSPKSTPTEAIAATQAPIPAGSVSYASQIQPIFTESCVQCHGSAGALTLESYDQLMAADVLIVGDPDGSMIIKRLTGEITPKMPRGGSLTDEQINLMRQWIEEGALNN